MRAALLIAERELRETLRDGRVVGMFLFPLILYPVMLWGVTQWSLLRDSTEVTIVLAWEGEPDTPTWLDVDGVAWVPGGQAAFDAGDAEGWVRAARGNDGIELTGRIPDIPRGPDARLRDAARDLRHAEAARLATVYSVPAEPPFTVERDTDETITLDIADTLSVLEPMLPGIPALLLVLLSSMAFYPALDAAAERERGTLGTSLVSAAGAGAIVWGKLITIGCLALLAVFAQGLALAITLAHVTMVIVASVSTSVVLIWPSLPDPVPLLAGAVVFATAGAAIGAIQLVAVLPWKTLQTSETAASIAMSGTIALVGAGWALGDAGALVPVANALPLGAAALMGEVAWGPAIGGALINAGLVVALAETARRIVLSERYRT